MQQRAVLDNVAFPKWICAVFLLAFVFLNPRLGVAEEGVWVKGDWVQINIACRQIWHCVPKNDVIYAGDEVLVSTQSEGVMGVCSVGAGPVDSCNHCLSNQPESNCEWQIEKRE